ncbi:MAG: YbaK/EbsC family protein [Anaeromyxobacter sp.]
MIPDPVDHYLHTHHPSCEHSSHLRAVTAQRVAAAEHVSGTRLAKPVVVRLGERLVLAVIGADRKLDLEVLSAVCGGLPAELAPEQTFAERFAPCEPGAEPPLNMFGLPLYVDAALAREPWVVMRAGTHEDTVRMSTDEWLEQEDARVVEGLGRHHL